MHDFRAFLPAFMLPKIQSKLKYEFSIFTHSTYKIQHDSCVFIKVSTVALRVAPKSIESHTMCLCLACEESAHGVYRGSKT
jgi:hypothetical protein